jgi:hypothetical protein
VCNPTL